MATAEMQTATFVERYVAADGFHVRYLEAGDGPPLLVIHGGGGLKLYHSHELLAQRYRVILLEVPGFGSSPANERSSSMAELALSVGAAATSLGIDTFNLMGNSFGGKLALWLAVQQPERVQALVLVAPAAIRREGPPPARPAGAGGAPGLLLYAHPERHTPEPPPGEEVLAKQQTLARRIMGPARDVELEERMVNLTVPTLVLFGTLDRMIPLELARLYQEKLPNCHVTFIYDAAHEADADRPEAFNALVTDFLERHEGFLVNQSSGLFHR
ncbi:MAG: alpha/beta fold hydrolase [Chloroflexota bacterium]